LFNRSPRAPTFLLRHDCIILDACCAINLFGSDKAAEILQSIEKPAAIAEYVREKEVLRFDLKPAIDSGLLTVVSPSERENSLTIDFAVDLDDGEAFTCALAVSRNWAVGIDDRRAISVLRRAEPWVQIVPSLELIKHWATVTAQTASTIHDVLENVRTKASYEPNRNHVLRGWWICTCQAALASEQQRFPCQ